MVEALALAADLLAETLVGVPLAPEGREVPVPEVPGAEVPVAEVPGAEVPVAEPETEPEALETMGGETVSIDG